MAIAPWIQYRIDNNLDITTGLDNGGGFITAPTPAPVEPVSVIAKHPQTWDSLSLLTQTQAVRSIQQQFNSADRSIGDNEAIALAKLDYTPAKTPVKATKTSSEGVFNLTLACQTANAKETQDSYNARVAADADWKDYKLPRKMGSSLCW